MTVPYTFATQAGPIPLSELDANFSALSTVTNITYNQGGTGAATITQQAKNQQTVNVMDFGATGNGTSDDTIPIQSAINALSSAGGILWFPAGTYRITATLNMWPYVNFFGSRSARIKQGNGANLTNMISFDTNTAINAGIYGITIDGNAANNITPSTNYQMIFTSQPNGRLIGNYFTNAPGFAINIRNGVGTVVDSNHFDGVGLSGVLIAGLAINTSTSARVINNVFTNIGLHAIATIWTDNNFISGNRVIGVTANQVVNTVGTAVTYVSGTNFANLRPGHIMRINFVEYQIYLVNSPTSVTLMVSAGTQTGVNSSSGTGDLINIDSSASTTVSDNTLNGGMSNGIVAHTSTGSENTTNLVIVGNNIAGCGEGGISVESFASPTNTIDTAIIAGNSVGSCGNGTVSNPSWANSGIIAYGPNTNNVLISGNMCRDYGTSTQTWGIYVDPAVGNGQATIGDNTLVGNTLGPISGSSWATYTPTVTSGTGTFTTVSATGRYRQIGKVVNFQVKVTITTNGTAAGSVNSTLPFPCTAAANYIAAGREDGVSGKMLQGKITGGGSTILIVNYDASYPGANGAIVYINGTYESA